MTCNTNNLFYRKEMWFLQTHLTSKEIRNLNFMCRKNVFNKVTIKNLLKKIIPNEERLMYLASSYDNFCFSFHNREKEFISKFELEYIMRKKLHEYTPLALQYSGTKEILKKPCVAIIGSRRPTFYGREQAFRFAKELSAKGCTIISGGAIGIDSIANSVAMEHGGGSCAILGSGIKNPYPPSNFYLFNHLKQSPVGLILSEFFRK